MSWLLEVVLPYSLGRMCLMISCFLGIQAQVWECQILGLGLLRTFFSAVQKLSVLVAVASVPSADHVRGFPFLSALSRIYGFRLVRMAIRTGGI